MRKIYPKGPYNILAVSWGGALAIEIAGILENDKFETNLYFVDSAPDTIQSAISHLNDGVGQDVNILCKLLNINDNEVNAFIIVWWLSLSKKHQSQRIYTTCDNCAVEG